MRKTLLLILVLAVLALGFLTLAFNQKPTQQTPAPIPSPTSILEPFMRSHGSPTPFIAPQGNTISISQIPINNFYKQTTPFNAQGDTIIAQVDNKYQIVYLADIQQFLISITGSPFEQNRQLAEQALLQKLNLSQSNACKLDVVIRTPNFANPDQAGQDFSLSFCQK